jgi:hypothetical protein
MKLENVGLKATPEANFPWTKCFQKIFPSLLEKIQMKKDSLNLIDQKFGRGGS